MSRPFRLVDVFGADPFTGNLLAAVADAERLSGVAAALQTSFLTRPG